MGPRLRGGDGKHRGGDNVRHSRNDPSFPQRSVIPAMIRHSRNDPSFPRKREPMVCQRKMGPRLRGGDGKHRGGDNVRHSRAGGNPFVTASGALILPALFAHFLPAGAVLLHHRALLV